MVEVSVARRVVVVQLAAEKDVSRSTRVAEKVSARDDSISTHFFEEVNRPATAEAALCWGQSELGAENTLEETVLRCLDGDEKAVEKTQGGVWE